MNIENLKTLSEVGHRVVRGRLPFDFNNWECGTTACLAGWYARLTDFKLPAFKLHVHESLQQHFGITPEQSYMLFNPAFIQEQGWRCDSNGQMYFQESEDVYKVLSDRLEWLDDQIYKAEKASPNNVLQIFSSQPVPQASRPTQLAVCSSL